MIENLDNWIPGRSAKGGVDISHAEQECEHHAKCHDSADNYIDDHHPGDCRGSSANFFAYLKDWVSGERKEIGPIPLTHMDCPIEP